MKFDDYAFSAEIKSGIQKSKFTDCTPVQEKTFDFVLEGRDVYAQSQTGTGKTAAFLISIFHLLQTEKHLNSKALIVVPTRELAVQIKEEADILSQDLNYTIGCFYGGTGYKPQEALLEKGVDIVIATPGRLLDFAKQGKIKFKEFSILVVDEADRLFDMGFVDDIRKIFNATKNVENKTTLLFSATMNPNVGNISWEYMNNPGEIFIEAEQLTVEAISQELYHVGKDEKMSVLLGLLNRENPGSAIIFTNTKHMAHEISKRLDHNGYKNEYLMGDLPQKKRLSIVNDVKDGKVKFLVATDVAARGLHVDDLSLVINYDLPLDTENYVHRIGRTARAGKDGKAITLACENYVYSLSGIEDYIDSKIPVFPTTDDLFVEDTSAHLRFNLNEHKNRTRENNRDNRNRDNRGRDNKSRDNRNRDNANRDNRNRDNKTTENKSTQNRPNQNRPNQNKNVQNKNVQNKNSNRKKHSETDAERLKRLRSSVMNVSGANSLDVDFEKDKKHPINKPSNQKSTNKPNKNNKKRNEYTRKKPSGNKPAMEGMKRVSSESKVEDRIAYYKKKYGEDFKISNTSTSKAKPKTAKPKTVKPKTAKPKKTTNKQAAVQTPTNKTGGLFSKIGKIFKK